MGMFDDIVCHVPLPDTPKEVQEALKNLQTKSLECYLQEYEIRADGTLWVKRFEQVFHEVSEEEKLRNPFSFPYRVERLDEHWEQVTLTGEVVFYDRLGWGPDVTWYEYSAYFVDGQLKELHRIHNRQSYMNKDG